MKRRYRVVWFGEAMSTDLRSFKGRARKLRQASYEFRASAENACRFLVEYGKTSTVPRIEEVSP